MRKSVEFGEVKNSVLNTLSVTLDKYIEENIINHLPKDLLSSLGEYKYQNIMNKTIDYVRDQVRHDQDNERHFEDGLLYFYELSENIDREQNKCEIYLTVKGNENEIENTLRYLMTNDIEYNINNLKEEI